MSKRRIHRADDLRSNAIDARVEEVETDMHAAQIVVADKLAAMAISSSPRITTWSLSCRTPRLTCSRISSRCVSTAESLSETTSVG